MKRSFTSFGLSALVHGGIIVLLAPWLWSSVNSPLKQPASIKLNLSQFQTQVPSKETVTTPPPITETASAEPPKLSKPNTSLKPANVAPQTSVTPKPLVAKPKEPPKPKESAKTSDKPKVKPEPKPLPDPVKAQAIKTPVAKREAQPEPPVSKPTVEPSVSHKTEQANAGATPPLKPASSQMERPVQRVAPANVSPRPAPVARVTPPAPVAQTTNPAAEAAYRRRMEALIAARKQYPPLAEKAEVEGSVTVAFTVLANGAISSASVVNSSGNQWLDNGALQAVKAASGALPFPPDLRKAQLVLTIVVHYRLE